MKKSAFSKLLLLTICLNAFTSTFAAGENVVSAVESDFQNLAQEWPGSPVTTFDEKLFNNGGEFQSIELKDYLAELRVKHVFNEAYKPSSNMIIKLKQII